jgi:hypothetical protein
VIEVRLKHKGVIVKTIYFKRFTEKIGKVARGKLTLAERKAGKREEEFIKTDPTSLSQISQSRTPHLSLSLNHVKSRRIYPKSDGIFRPNK